MNDFHHSDDFEALFDRTYLRWFDLNGEPALVEISDVERKELTVRGGSKKRAPVATLSLVSGKITNLKPLVLNVTNAETIATFLGRRPSAWIGNRIVLFVTETQLKGRTVPCIRVRQPKQKAAS